MIEIDDLRFSYSETPVLSIDSFRILPGEIVAIQGDNGTGKTTLLKLLAGIIPGPPGSISYLGVDQTISRFDRLQSDSVYVHQEPYLLSGSVFRNVASAIHPKTNRADTQREVSTKLKLVDLQGFEGRHIRKLSGGEKKRVALARALAANPKVLLLDEPTASVDSRTSDRICSLIRLLAKKNRTIVFSTHEPDIAYRVSDRLVTLRDGNIAPVDLNIYRGSVKRTDESFLYFTTGDCEIRCPLRDGDFSAAVLPYDDVILSEFRVETSAQNQIEGKVVEISAIGTRFRICLDCGVRIFSHITGRSVSQMGIEEGKKLYAVFKASAIRLY